jgi:hypothetical protein
VDLTLTRRFSVTRARYTALDSLVWGWPWPSSCVGGSFAWSCPLVMTRTRMWWGGLTRRSFVSRNRECSPECRVKRASRRRSLGRAVAPPLGPAAPVGQHAPLAPAPLRGTGRARVAAVHPAAARRNATAFADAAVGKPQGGVVRDHGAPLRRRTILVRSAARAQLGALLPASVGSL